MWQDFNSDGVLKYPNFLETVTQIIPMYKLRSIGGGLYLTGALVMVYNLLMTMSKAKLLANKPRKHQLYKSLSFSGHDTFWHRQN